MILMVDRRPNGAGSLGKHSKAARKVWDNMGDKVGISWTNLFSLLFLKRKFFHYCEKNKSLLASPPENGGRPHQLRAFETRNSTHDSERSLATSSVFIYMSERSLIRVRGRGEQLALGRRLSIL